MRASNTSSRVRISGQMISATTSASACQVMVSRITKQPIDETKLAETSSQGQRV
eukprot:COSAG02_NODE_107_length_36312_cov_45.037942_14_plen_54_part_00